MLNEIVNCSGGRYISRGVVLSVCGAVLVEGDVLVAVQVVFDGPVAAVESQQVLRRSPRGGEAGDEPCGFVFSHPCAFALDRALALDTGDLPDAGPALDLAYGFNRQHIDAALFDAAMGFADVFRVAAEGGMSASRTP